MNYLKAILAQIEDLTGIKDIVGASEEIASMKMRAIRNKVLLSREMNDELTEIYREVSTSYKNQIYQLIQERKGHKIVNKSDTLKLTLKAGNGKLACVYLSATSGLFSKILERTYYQFVNYLNKNQEAVPIIIGEYGKKLFSSDYPNRQFIFYSLPEDQTSEEALKKITQELSEYSNVIIFYARFESMVSQTTSVLDVSGLDQDGNNKPIPAVHYLFEPSLEKIIAFFESEIFAGIIQQTVTESDLARYASRITTLDMARENISQQLKHTDLEKRFAMHRLLNKKQTESLTGLSLWKLR